MWCPGKKKDMMSMFSSKAALEKQADKLSAKQEELNIKSTGWQRSDERVSISAANRSIGSTTGCTITEKAPTRAFSWLKAPTSAFTFTTL